MNFKIDFSMSNLYTEFNLKINMFDSYSDPTFTLYNENKDKKINIDKDNNDLLCIYEIRENSNKILQSLSMNEDNFFDLYKDKKVKCIDRELYILFDRITNVNNIHGIFVTNHYIDIVIIQDIDINNSCDIIKKIFLDTNI